MVIKRDGYGAEVRLSKQPKHIPEGFWWKKKGVLFFSEVRP